MQAQISNEKNELRNEMKTLIQASMSNQTNELKNVMASFFQMNTASTSGSGPLPSNTIANPKGELKAITTRSGLVLDGPFVPMPPPFINPEEDERKLPEKLGNPGKFLILYGFSELQCKALADLEKVRPFLRTACALIDVHEEEMILCDGDERLTLNTRHDTSSYSNQPHKESINMINIYNDSYEDYLEDLFTTNHLSGNLTFSSYTDLTSPKGNDDLPFDIESNLREIEYLLNHDPTKEMDSVLEDSVDEENLTDPNNDLVDTILEMFTDEHTLDYSSPPLYDDIDDDLVEIESDNDDVYDDSFDSKEDYIKKSKLLIDELDPPRSILEDFNPPLYELPFYKEVPGSKTLLSFSSENEEKVFKPRIPTSKGVHTSFLPELSHRGPKAFKVIKNFESPMKIFPCSYGEDIRISDVPYLHFYPS
uniref:Reverse transcriptase domain-containing protein n=1 Tax=Tanacetum cinerariifolium TaxID=118510 RepID=A0A6L2N4S8_TANCI|nr:reverse transcriptase domain-containing protein [Tanacetum cinerariifolium]